MEFLAMIFTGRLLASDHGISIWEEQKDRFLLHLVDHGMVIPLTLDELTALARASATAVNTAGTPEAAKDRVRRLQILQARVTDLLRRERAAPTDKPAH
jgi:hypothetical protein